MWRFAFSFVLVGCTVPTPPGFVRIPAGSFVINDTNPQFDRRLGPNTHVGIG